MKNEFSKYSYSPSNIMKAGILCAIAFCLLILLHGTIAVQYFPSSVLLDTDVLFSRIVTGIISFFLAVVLVFYTRDYFQSIISAHFLVSLSGLVILILFAFTYFLIGKFIGGMNCEKLKMSGCYNLSIEQFILAAVLAFIFSFSLTAVLFALAHSLYRIKSKSEYLR